MVAAKKDEGPVEHPAFADRPQDEPEPNTTFADRAKARKPKKKAVQSAENKAVTAATRKGGK
jgi:hypothetical protein